MLALEDGSIYEGLSCGGEGESVGEICFNTSLEGYAEVISDPSYAGQIIVMTYPQIGNYGLHRDDLQRTRPALRGLVVHDMCELPSNWRSQMSLSAYLKEHGIPALEGVDTRSLVRHIRSKGAMQAVISTEDLDPQSLIEKAQQAPRLVGENLVATVSPVDQALFSKERPSHAFALAEGKPEAYRVVAYDCGAKESILHGLRRAGMEVITVPWDTPAETVISLGADGVFLSNGPGDPTAVEGTYAEVKKLMGRIPLFGICLGHQMLSLAAGATIEKLAFGHRGGNHPVMNLISHRVEITAQNHGFGIRFDSLGPLVKELSGGREDHPEDLRSWVERGIAPVVDNPIFGKIRLTHVNLNDGTPEGIAFLDIPAFSVQYHPEAAPGPTDAHYLFTAFARLMDDEVDYLDIDIAADRLVGWKF